MYPHEFELLWRLSSERLTAGEIAEILNRPIHRPFTRTGPAVANQLRGLKQRGFVAADGGSPAIYSLTEKGEEYIDA